MNKDEILKKSRKENENGDERYLQLKLKTHSITLYIIFAFCCLCGVLGPFIERNMEAFFPDVFLILMMFISLFPTVILAIRCKHERDVSLAVVGSIVFITRLVSFILGW